MSARNRTDHRTRLIEGLRALADFLEDRPELPVPDMVHATVCVLHGSEEERKAEVERIGRLIGMPLNPADADLGYHSAEVRFGPLLYGAMTATEARRARTNALMSYQDCVSPDLPPGA
ncbi:hypothetical protein ACQP2T_60100 [Nonomuraea sp. CA-143628]|uniref:hypothetical protein n=1 Tax=Nonomuraea sp. CA-143628 TaxID=3239997 RepID=UPI003D90AD18